MNMLRNNLSKTWLIVVCLFCIALLLCCRHYHEDPLEELGCPFCQAKHAGYLLARQFILFIPVAYILILALCLLAPFFNFSETLYGLRAPPAAFSIWTGFYNC